MTELYYCKSLFLAGNITQLHDFKDGALKILPRFSLFFDDLLRDGDFSSCLKLARCYSKSIDSPARAKLLDILEVHASTPTLIRTKAWIALAELCTDSSESSRQMELYKHAKESLLTSHAHIEIDLDLSMYYHACHNPSEENAQPDTDVGKLIYKYEEMDYPAGTLGALEKLLDLAMRVHNFDLSLGLSEEFDRIARETGSLLLWAMIKLRTLGYWHIRTGHDALVLTSAKELCGELLKFECPYHLGNTAQIITDVNLRLKETDEAIKWSLLCAETWNTCSPSAKSMAAFYVLQAKILAVEKSKEVVQPLIDWVDKMVEDDIAQNLVDNAIMKLDTIVTLLFQTHLIPENVKAEKIKELLGRIETYSKGLPQGQIEVKLANLYQHQAILHLANAKGKPDINTEDQALELQERAIQLYHKQRDPKLMLPLAVTRLQTGLTWHAIFKKIAKLDRKAGHVALDNALRMFGLSKQGFEAISSIELISQALYWVALNQYERWCEGLCHGELVLRSLSDAERGMNNHREELSMLGGVSAVASKQKISSSKHFRDVYRFAFQICVVEQRFQQAWIWVQKAKARSLSDLLGLGIGVPRTLLERIETQEDAHLLYKKENELAAILAATDPAARFHVRTQLEKLHLEMQDVQVLAELLNIRNGVPMALEQLQDIFSDNESGLTSKNVVFVDWFIQSDEIYLVVLKPPGTEPAVRRLNITLSFVKMWVEEFLKTPRGREESIEKDESEFDRPLAELDPLVEFLAELTEGGDVLIFSPTGILNSVPLHALRLPQSPQAIIERNPTIYCSSLTTFVQCCRRAATAVRPTQQKKTIISIYEESPEERLDENERAEIYETTGKLAETLNADHLSGIAVTPEIVKEHLPSSHLVHFHGHCDTSENNILDQSLRLSDGKGGIGNVVPWQSTIITLTNRSQNTSQSGISSPCLSPHHTSLYWPAVLQPSKSISAMSPSA